MTNSAAAVPAAKITWDDVKEHLRPSDAIGIAQLVIDATVGITSISEGANQAVWGTLGFPGGKEKGQTRGLTGGVFKSVKGITKLVGQGLDLGFKLMLPLDEDKPTTPQREAVLAALNGVLGDHMAASGNPLTTPMRFRHQGHVLDVNAPQATSGKLGKKILLMIHGACMNDLQWRTELDGKVVDFGQDLSAEFGYTPIYLRYNSGKHVSENGRELAAQLELLLQNWPVAVSELVILVHSMGGLITRSAVHYGREGGDAWISKLKKVYFLGTPHWGSPLERAGNLVDIILAATPYSAPYAKLGQIRSAGVTDLRHGYFLDEDWNGHDRFKRRPDHRAPLPLPESIGWYTIAATLAAKRSPLADRLVGDGLVPLNSALGKHADAQRSLNFSEDAQVIFHNMAHVALLSRPEVGEQLFAWFNQDRSKGKRRSAK